MADTSERIWPITGTHSRNIAYRGVDLAMRGSLPEYDDKGGHHFPLRQNWTTYLRICKTLIKAYGPKKEKKDGKIR